MNNILKAAIILLLITFSVAALSEAIRSVGKVPTIFNIDSQGGRPGNTSSNDTIKEDEIVSFRKNAGFQYFNETQGEASTPDLEIHGKTGTSYIRCIVFDLYNLDNWKMLESNSQLYGGEALSSQVSLYSSRENMTAEIKALKPILGFLPAFLGVSQINNLTTLEYFPESGVFSTYNTIITPYVVRYTNYLYEETLLNSSKIVSKPDELQVPAELKAKIQPLAQLIVGNATTSYLKVARLVSYLKTNYVYNLTYPSPPTGVDVVEYFLFTSKEGVCIHFNSALVLMLRSIGVPSRLVGGYLIEPDAAEQQVYPKQRHAYAEVPFEGLGWVTFDATASSACKDCEAIMKPEEGKPQDGTGNQDGGIKPTEDPPDSLEIKDNINNSTSISAQGGLPPDIDLFEIYGQTHTSYLRTSVGEYYDKGIWKITEPKPEPYAGELLHNEVKFAQGTVDNRFIISPLLDMGGFIPTVKYTNTVDLKPLSYYPGHMLFFTSKLTMQQFGVSHTVYTHALSILRNAALVVDPRYLNVPEELREKLRSIALPVTAGVANQYDKLKALEGYLQTTYTYDLNYTRAPPNEDPVEWFLFKEKRGVCSNFNSAFVLLARSVGLPARVVSGYLIDSSSDYQVVNAQQGHCYSEVPFEGVGWVTFDTTGGGSSNEQVPKNPVPTFTEILWQDSYGIRGFQFKVDGTVKDTAQSPVSGLKILIYLKESKTDVGLLVGNGQIDGGVFNVVCDIPESVENGDYLIQAHTIGNKIYNSSWSDPPFKVMSRARLELEIPSKVINGESFNYIGNLTDYLTSKPLDGQVCYLETRGERLTLRTDEKGLVRGTLAGLAKGDYNYTLTWPGNTDYLPINATATVRVLPLTISYQNTDTLIRFDFARLLGRVHAEELPAKSRIVKVYMDEALIGEAQTDGAGMFIISYLIPATRELGSALLTYRVESLQYPVDEASQSCSVFARTSLSFQAPPVLSLDKDNILSASLVDDLEQPMIKSNVTLNYSLDKKQTSLSKITDDEGVSNFTIRVDDPPKNTTLIGATEFSGRGYYLPSKASLQLSILIPPDMTLTYLLIAGVTSILGIGGYLSWRRMKKRTLRDDFQDTITPAFTSIEEEGISIEFPQIKPPLPAVWGVGEPIEVKATPQALGSSLKDVIISIDNISVNNKSIDQTSVCATLMFDSIGIHKISASIPDAGNQRRASLELKVVNYREEITALYNDFHKEQRLKNSAIREDCTARELHHILTLGQGNESRELDIMVNIFEIADYSLHDITRAEYERFYISKHKWEAMHPG